MEWICGNGIAEIGGKKNKFAIGLWQCHCQNREKNYGNYGKNCGNCGNAIAENGKKKKIVVRALSDTTKVEVESSCK